MQYEQLNLFIQNELSNPDVYSDDYKYMAFSNGCNSPIEAMKRYKNYILHEIARAETLEKKKQWENALESIERQLKDFKEML